MKSRKILYILFIAVLAFGCKSEDLGPSNDFYEYEASFASATGRILYPFGRYKLAALENNSNIIYNVDLEIKNEKDSEGFFIINGQCNANFYFAKFEADFVKQTVRINGVASTKIGGTYNELLFEKDFLERLSKVTSYQFSVDGTKLIFLLPTNDQKLIFDLNKN
ncbi:hypothetical protein SAMN06298216_1807 [Spirosomataceae bacterium TFI 002]|nr:hypothetical protein SAMN06298216_1807 [Spirosomataceae bacterium TFI 002]